MHEPASEHGQDEPVATASEPAADPDLRQIMSYNAHESDGRYAALDTEDGLLLYDTENRTAWIESDTTQTLRR